MILKLTIDRIENEIAVVITDEGKRFNISSELFPDIKEGNIYNISLDEEEMKIRMQKIKEIADDIWE